MTESFMLLNEDAYPLMISISIDIEKTKDAIQLVQELVERKVK